MAPVQIEEAKLSHETLKRSEHDNLQSDLRGGTKRLFFEVAPTRKMRGGKLVNVGPNDPWLKDFAQKNLVIGITGAKSKLEALPCYTFADNGEGQSQDEFERTFLSLSAGNKKSISFVQGKFNMGSSGVLRCCGRHWFKLIVSRRHDGKGDWGWTLRRRRPGDRD